MEPKVSVIIPAYNEEAVIEDCLESLVHQSMEDYHVYVIDDASTDSTRARILKYCQKYPQKFSLKEYGKVGPGKARNITAYNCGSEYLAFMDADCIATATWLENLLKAFFQDDIGSAGGPHLAPPQSNKFQQEVEKVLKWISPSIDFYKSRSKGIRLVAHNPLCNVAYRRDVFMRLRGFREDLFPGEDVEFDLRVTAEGFKISFNPEAIVYHHRPSNIQQWSKVIRAYGRSQGKLVREAGLQRDLHYIGVLWILALLSLGWGLSYSFGWFGFSAFVLILLIHFFFRPKWNNALGIWIHLAEWLNGFIQGFLTNRSPPPGSKEQK